MKQYSIITLLLILFFSTACCTKQERMDWHEIDQLVSTSPDSAYRFLKDLDSGKMNEWDKNMAVVYMIDSKNKSFVRLDEQDYLAIQKATDYFNRQDNPYLVAKSLYLTGSACHDLSDNPQALDYFMDALEKMNATDTIHHSELSISIWGQIAGIYKSQYMTDKSKKIEQRIIDYYKSIDDKKGTLDFEFSSLIGSYKEKKYDDVSDHILGIYQRYLNLGDTINAGRSLKIGILANINLGRWEDANKQICLYEEYSGSVTDKGYASAGSELYYFMKGMCLLHEHQFDSAEIFFRRELSPEANWNNREAAYTGLSELYLMTQQKDSALKYLQLKSIAVDSNYQNRISERIQQFASFYDYSRQKAEKEKLTFKAERLRNHLRITLLLSILIIIISCSVLLLVFNRKRNKLKLEAERRERLNERCLMRKDIEIKDHQNKIDIMETELATMQKDMEEMRRELIEKETTMVRTNDETDSGEQSMKQTQEIGKLKLLLATALDEIDKKKNEIRNYTKEIEILKKDKQLLQNINDKTITHDSIISGINKALTDKHNLTPDQWKEIHFFCKNETPRFFERITEKIPNLTETELHCCLLELLEIPTNKISVLLHQTNASVTNLRKRIYMKAEKKKDTTSDEARRWFKRMKR